MWHGKMLRCSEAMAEIIPKRDAEFATGVHQSEESVATIATGVAVRATADLALDDVTANVALGTYGTTTLFAAWRPPQARWSPQCAGNRPSRRR